MHSSSTQTLVAGPLWLVPSSVLYPELDILSLLCPQHAKRDVQITKRNFQSQPHKHFWFLVVVTTKGASSLTFSPSQQRSYETKRLIKSWFYMHFFVCVCVISWCFRFSFYFLCVWIDMCKKRVMLHFHSGICNMSSFIKSGLFPKEN